MQSERLESSNSCLLRIWPPSKRLLDFRIIHGSMKLLNISKICNLRVAFHKISPVTRSNCWCSLKWTRNFKESFRSRSRNGRDLSRHAESPPLYLVKLSRDSTPHQWGVNAFAGLSICFDTNSWKHGYPRICAWRIWSDTGVDFQRNMGDRLHYDLKVGRFFWAFYLFLVKPVVPACSSQNV